MINFRQFVHRFDRPELDAIALMGSHARNEAGPFSDIDIVCFTGQSDLNTPHDGSHIIENHLVVVSTIKPNIVEGWFSEPEQATNVIAGLRVAKPLIDKHNFFATIQARANAFTWDVKMQEKANNYASQEMVGWIEEVHKGLNGLQTNQIGQLLNARFGLSWGLLNVMKVQRGVLITSDNSIYDQVVMDIGNDSQWAKLSKLAFGLSSKNTLSRLLHEETKAGLALYRETAILLNGTLRPKDRPLIEHTVDLIQNIDLLSLDDYF